MKKIGILTFHNAYNYGAVLQAYALREFLQKNSNCIVEIINYKNEQIEKEKSRWNGLFNNNVVKELARNLLTTPYYLKLDRTFSGFVDKYLTADNEIKKEELSSLKYDLYLVGSDQVWNLPLTGNIDILKTICAFLIICIHAPFPGEEGAYFTTVTRIAVPIFFMITGYFYENTKRLHRELSQIKKVFVLAVEANLLYFIWNIALNVLKGERVIDYIHSAFTGKNLLKFSCL